MKKKYPFVNRELSWLSFNERVLQEAEDETVPLIERVKFLGIYSNNQDEFFRVRVANVNRKVIIADNVQAEIAKLENNPAKLLNKIQKKVLQQQKRFEKAYKRIFKTLSNEGVHLINEKQIPKEKSDFVREYFRQKVLPALNPIMLETAPQFPYLVDKSIYFIVELVDKNKKAKFALLEIPTGVVSRFLIIPKNKEENYIVLLDDVIRYCLDDIFSVLEYTSIAAYTIKLTRDAELDIDNKFSRNIVKRVSGSLKKRKRGVPVRLVYDSDISSIVLTYISKLLKLRKSENLIPGGRYHNFKDFMDFPDMGRKDLLNKPTSPLNHPNLHFNASTFDVLKKRDILLTYPYQSFHHIIDFLREASIDPKVTAISTTVYRVANNSKITNALLNAIKNGKRVTVVIELQARFDEENNIYWAQKLKDEGARVIYGVPGLKVHSKILLISRREKKNRLTHYAHIGTGNFNEKTATVYSDMSLLTSHKAIANDVQALFQFYKNNARIKSFQELVVSPFSMRKHFSKLIDAEISNASKGLPAFITIKLNNLVDRGMTDKLYKASQKGVKVKLIVRGMCSIAQGLKGISENMEVISIVDKYLEHARVFVFCNAGDNKYYITSADWMPRNLDNRSEVAVPIYDKHIQETIVTVLDLQFNDNCKARIINAEQNNNYKIAAKNKKIVRSQNAIYSYFKKLSKQKE